MLNKSHLISTSWLHSHLNDPSIVILQVAMNSVNENVQSTGRYIPNSIIFDIEYFSDQNSDLPHTAPKYEDFCTKIHGYGIERNNNVVIYDEVGIYSSPWVWWLFKLMGHKNVFVLDGGLRKWSSEGRPTSSTPVIPNKPMNWSNYYVSSLMVDKQDVLNTTSQVSPKSILDARDYKRYIGEVEEPRPGLQRGHIPNAVNIPYHTLIDDDGTYKSIDLILKKFKDRKINLDQEMFFYCGSGITACILLFAASELGANKLSLYDGSWSEWGRCELPIS